MKGTHFHWDKSPWVCSHSYGQWRRDRGKTRRVGGHRSQGKRAFKKECYWVVTQVRSKKWPLDLMTWKSLVPLISGVAVWWQGSVSVICHWITNPQVFNAWTIYSLSWFSGLTGRQLCSVWFWMVSMMFTVIWNQTGWNIQPGSL